MKRDNRSWRGSPLGFPFFAIVLGMTVLLLFDDRLPPQLWGKGSPPAAHAAEDSGSGELEDSAGWDFEAASAVEEAGPPAFSPDRVEEFQEKGDWCQPHRVPESMCTLCNPDLIPKFKESGDWCGGHGVPESLCALCNRSLREVGVGLSPGPGSGHGAVTLTPESLAELRESGDWCAEHSVPESLCIQCNPDRISEFKEKGDWCREHDVPESLCADCNPAVAALGIGKDWCEKHQLPESQCVFCHPELASVSGNATQALRTRGIWTEPMPLSEIHHLLGPILSTDQGQEQDTEQRLGINPTCRLHASQILFASPEIAEEVGIETATVGTENIRESISCYGEIRYNKSRFVWLSTRAAGIVDAVSADLGDFIRKGQVVAVVDSSDLGEAKAALLRANAEVNRWRWVNESYESSNGSGAISRKDLVEAKAALVQASIEIEIAIQKLRNYGLSEESIQRVLERHNTSTLLPVAAPFDSTVVELRAVPGDVVDRGGPILALADTSTMWAILDVFVRDLPKVRKGQRVTFSADGLHGQVFHGTLDWISSQLDERTRTAKVRAVLNNPYGDVRAGLFGRGEIGTTDDREFLTVPREAVQWDGCCNVVFVRRTSQLYQPRKIRIGYATKDSYVVRGGLFPGEQVVTTGSYLLKTEILKGSIGAGCTCGG